MLLLRNGTSIWAAKRSRLVESASLTAPQVINLVDFAKELPLHEAEPPPLFSVSDPMKDCTRTKHWVLANQRQQVVDFVCDEFGIESWGKGNLSLGVMFKMKSMAKKQVAKRPGRKQLKAAQSGTAPGGAVKTDLFKKAGKGVILTKKMAFASSDDKEKARRAKNQKRQQKMQHGYVDPFSMAGETTAWVCGRCRSQNQVRGCSLEAKT